MGKNIFTFKWISLLAVFLTGLFFLIGPVYADWTVVDSSSVGLSDWQLFSIRFPWAAGQDSEQQQGVLLYFSNGSWIPAVLPDVSSNWALSGVDLTSSSTGWAVGQDITNQRGVLIYFIIPSVAGVPTVTTTTVTSVTDTTATGGGNVTSDGGEPLTAEGVCWDTSPNPVVGGNCTDDGTVTGVFTSSITGLTATTLYYVRAYATNSVGTGYGNDLTFTTTVSSVPTVTTTQPINITSTQATGGGNVTSAGGTALTAEGVCWDTSPDPVVGGNCTDDGTVTGQFTSFITGLTPSTTYHVRAYATNSTDTGYGNDVTFTTLGSTTSTLTLSTSTTTPISKITATAASGSNLIWRFLNVMPPNVSTNWGLSSVHFPLSDKGWAVGQDFENQRGVILYFSDYSWTFIPPPKVSSNWGLSAVHFIWAVGQDLENGSGVILRFTGTSWTSVPLSNINISSNWGLSAVRFISSGEAWAVGTDFANETGVILHFLNGLWTSVSPPTVSSNWGLSSVDFASSNEGWAVGTDYSGGENNYKGVILHFLNGSWTSFNLPTVSSNGNVSSNWGLSGIDLMSAVSGWAVGSDSTNMTAVLLTYTAPRISVSPKSLDFKEVEINANLGKTVTVTNTGNESLAIDMVTFTPPSAPFSVSTDNCSNHTLAPSKTCKITYEFLPTSAGYFNAISNIIPSNSSNQNPQNPGTVSLKGIGVTDSISNVMGPDNVTFSACDYVDAKPPTFQWDPINSKIFSSIGVQFSPNSNFSGVSLKVNGNLQSNVLNIQKTVWKRILLLPGANGGTVYWKVIANKRDKTTSESSAFSFTVGPPGPVDNVGISSTSKAPPPTLSWNNNCNILFTVWFGNDSNFNLHTKKLSLSFKIVNPNPVPATFETTLSTSQWNSIQKLVGAGNTISWYVQSQDGLGRRQATPVMNFNLTD